LFGIKGYDPSVIVAAVAALSVVVLGASYLRGATRLEDRADGGIAA
jgi:hypothetical protein